MYVRTHTMKLRATLLFLFILSWGLCAIYVVWSHFPTRIMTAETQCHHLAGIVARELADRKANSASEAEVRAFLDGIPSGSRLLPKNSKGQFTDVWGQPLHVQVRFTGAEIVVTVIGKGPDRKSDTADDIKGEYRCPQRD